MDTEREIEKRNCACYKQIVWFFEKPTIIVCEKCEKTFHYLAKYCNECGGQLSYYVKEEK